MRQKKWEYIATWVDYAEIHSDLTAYGEGGWELVTAQLNDREGRWYLIYKRPKK